MPNRGSHKTSYSSSRLNVPTILRRSIKFLFLLLFASDLAPGFRRYAALRGGASLDNNENHQTKNSFRSFGKFFTRNTFHFVTFPVSSAERLNA
jgi:hypothetical protein